MPEQPPAGRRRPRRPSEPTQILLHLDGPEHQIVKRLVMDFGTRSKEAAIKRALRERGAVPSGDPLTFLGELEIRIRERLAENRPGAEEGLLEALELVQGLRTVLAARASSLPGSR